MIGDSRRLSRIVPTANLGARGLGIGGGGMAMARAREGLRSAKPGSIYRQGLRTEERAAPSPGNYDFGSEQREYSEKVPSSSLSPQ